MACLITVSNVDFQSVKRHRSILSRGKKNLSSLLKNKRRRKRLRRNPLPRAKKSLKSAKLTTSISAKRS